MDGKLMRRAFTVAALLFLLGAGTVGNAMLVPITFAPSAGFANITGPCDLVTCDGASYSLTRAMKNSYTGNLFQLTNGSSTLDVGQVPSTRVADLSAIPAFCNAGSICLYSKIYDQSGNGNHLTPVVGNPGIAPAQCTAGNACAAPFLLDPHNGLPSIVTNYPSEYDIASTIPGGQNDPVTVMYFGRNELYPQHFGTGHSPTDPNNNGTTFELTPFFSNTPSLVQPPWTSGYINCSGATVLCLGLAEETSVDPYSVAVAPGAIGAAYTGAGDMLLMATFDGVAATNTVKLYGNSATAIYTGSPPASFQYDGSQLHNNTHIKLGCGGDCVHINVIFREGLITNSVLSSSDYTAISSNISTFYGAHTARATCSGTADAFYTGTLNPYPAYGGLDYPSLSYYAWSVAQIRASYFGPTVQLYDGSSTQDFSSAYAKGESSSCGLEAAAASFCSGGCTVSKLYNQGTYTGNRIFNTVDANNAIVFAAGQRPAYAATGLNGLPTMTFSGSEYGCTASIAAHGGSFGLSAVSKRSGSAAGMLWMGGSGLSMEYTGSANTVGFWAGSFFTATASDNNWHHLYQEARASATEEGFVDNSSVGSWGGNTYLNQMGGGVTCLGARTNGTSRFTGSVAEFSIIGTQYPTSGFYTTRAAAMNVRATAVWGSLP